MRRWLHPRLLALHALAVVLVAACVVMGLWQLGVYGDKHEDAAKTALAKAPVELLTVWGPDDPFAADLAGRRVWVRGTFTGEQFRVERSGDVEWVLAPLRVKGTRSNLLIVRGSITPASPTPPVPRGRVTFRAVLQPGEEGPGGYDPGTGRLRTISIPALANVVVGDLFSGYALTVPQAHRAGDTPGVGIDGDLTPVAAAAPDVSWTVGLRNLAYALQWWVFGLFAGFMWWRMASEAVEVEASVVEASRVA